MRRWLLLAGLGLLSGCGRPPEPLPALNASYEQALASTAPQAVVLVPGSELERRAFGNLERYFAGMTSGSVRDQTPSVYAPDAYLNDTLVGIDGAANIAAYFGHTVERARLLKVEFLDRAPVGTDWYARWRMTVVADGLNGGQPVVTYGVTQLRFDSEGRVLLHKDFWDAGSGLYEQLPLLGRIIGWIRGSGGVSLLIDLCERGLIPDAFTRFGMRRLMAGRLRAERADGGELQYAIFRQRLAGLRQSPVAIETDKANEQHYEVPAAFFQRVLGPHLKYSCCWYGDGARSLGEAEEAMLQLTGARAELADGQQILELGCGWGSLTLWMAARFPNSRITAVSNSASQRQYILGQARERGLANVAVITADANVFSTDERFDRVVSVEMFEHMRNYATLMERIAGWLRPGGKLFVHIFCHRSLMYPFTVAGDDDWMARYFFTGGLMPAESTLLHFQEHLTLEDQWRVSGTHYERTANDWLANQDRERRAVLAVLTEAYGAQDAALWFQRWRMFFMAVAELFGYAGGTEWLVAHYRFVR